MRLASVGIANLVLLVSVGSIQADTLFLIAKAGDVIDGRELRLVGSEFDMNQNDEIAFRASFDEGERWFTDAVFTQHRLVAAEGDTIDGVVLQNPWGCPSINDLGDVAFRGNGVFVNRRLVSPYLSYDPRISDSGAVAFVGTSSGGDNGLVVDDQVLLRLGDTIDGRTFNGFGNYPLIRINARDDIAFFWFEGDAIVVLPGNRVVAGAATVIDGKTLLSVRSNHHVPINDSGEVAFWARFDGGAGIFTQNELIVAEGDAIGGKTLTSFYGANSMNNAGEIAFVAAFDGGKGVFTQNRLVAQIGDAIEGRTLTEIRGFPEINDLGHVAFSAEFADGSSGIVLAVPEPSVAVLLVAGAGVLAFRAVARRRRLPEYGGPSGASPTMNAVEENRGTSHGAKMPCAAVKRERAILAVIAFSYLGVTIGAALLIVLTMLVAHGPPAAPRAVLSLVRAALEHCLALPLFCLVPLIAFTALLTAEIVVELFRFGTHRTRSWSDKWHLIAVVMVWMALLSVQLPLALLMR